MNIMHRPCVRNAKGTRRTRNSRYIFMYSSTRKCSRNTIIINNNNNIKDRILDITRVSSPYAYKCNR